MKAKKILLSTIIATQVLTASALAAPDEAIKEFNKVAPIKQEVKHFQGEVKLFIIKDGEKVRVDQKMTDGLRVVNGRTCVGVRDLVNAIEGAKVEWDGTNHIVDITYAGKTISYPAGKPLMWADGKAVTIDVAAQIDPAISKTFLPIRNIAETLGFKVDWDNKAKEVVLTPGAAQTTAAQQTRPTTQTPQTPTQNKNLAWVTASGQRIPKPEELPVAKFNSNDEGRICYDGFNVKVKAEDLTHNQDGSITYFKGTVLEYTTGVPFKKVNTIAQRPSNWNIFKENKNDPRVGTAIVTKGYSEYDNAVNNSINNLLSGKDGKDNFFSSDTILNFTNIGMTKISKDDFKNQYKNINRKKSSEFALEELDSTIISSEEIFDATGILSVTPSGIYGKSNGVEGIFFNFTPDIYITLDGAVIDNIETDDYIKKYGNFIIDKVIYSQYGKYIVDIPNINYKEYVKNNRKYSCRKFSIGDFTLPSYSK